MTGVSYSKPAKAQFTIRNIRGSYFVIDPNGRPVGAGHGKDVDGAMLKRDSHQAAADLAAKRKVRPCLRCSTPFESEGAHNRMCGRCRCLGGDPIPDAFRNPRKRYA